MPEVLAAVLGWLIPAVVVFGGSALALAVIVWAVRSAARSPRARARAEAKRRTAGVKLVELDDQVAELDLEVGLSGALYGGGAPSSLRRARMVAQHTRDELFENYRVVMAAETAPHDVAREAERIAFRADRALATIRRARSDHDAWVRANVTAADQITAAQQRLAALRSSMGDPAALVAELSARFAEDEWRESARSASAAIGDADDAERLLVRAAQQAEDPSQSSLSALADAERALRSAQDEARSLEDSHRLITQAATALPSEFEAARTALRQAMVTREELEPVDADRLSAAIRGAAAELDAAEHDAQSRPTATVERIARVRDLLDLALGDARTAQQRLRGARTALPGTIAAARGVVARAEASVGQAHSGADARVRLECAQRELADARRAKDPVEALDAARRAMRHAEDAIALAAYERLR